MDEKRVGQKILVIVTGLTALAILITAGIYQAVRIPEPIVIDTTGQPSIGNPFAPVELVLFEDLRCGTCRDFDAAIMPKLKTRYIDTGQVRYTVVLLSFLEGSKPLANAALAVYRLAPEQFLPFVHKIFQQFLNPPAEGSEKEILLSIARQLGGIDLLQLEKCIDTRCHYETLDQNFFWAKKLMGNDLKTPSLYVNGVATPVLPFRAVQTQIERALQLQKAQRNQ